MRLLGLKEVAERTGYSTKTLWNWASLQRAGVQVAHPMPFRRRGRRLMVEESELDRWLTVSAPLEVSKISVGDLQDSRVCHLTGDSRGAL